MLVYQRVKAVAGGEAAEKLRMDDVPTLSQSTLAMKLLQFFFWGGERQLRSGRLD